MALSGCATAVQGRCEACTSSLAPAAIRLRRQQPHCLPHHLRSLPGSSNTSRCRARQLQCCASSNKDDEYTYSGLLNQFLGRLLPGGGTKEDPLAHIDWDAPKRTGLSLAALRDALEAAWERSPWMVTGEVSIAGDRDAAYAAMSTCMPGSTQQLSRCRDQCNSWDLHIV